MDFAHIAFGLADQVCFGPAQLVELFAKDATSLCLGGFTSNLAREVGFFNAPSRRIFLAAKLGSACSASTITRPKVTRDKGVSPNY